MKFMHTRLPDFYTKVKAAAKKLRPDTEVTISGLENVKTAKMASLRVGRVEDEIIDITEDEDIKKLIDAIFEGMKGSIQQYVERKLNPKDVMDKMLDMRNIMLWSKRDVESAVCNWLYERGLKK